MKRIIKLLRGASLNMQGFAAPGLTNSFFSYWHIYPPITRKRPRAVRVRLGVAGHLSTIPKWGIPLSAFSNGTTSELAGLLRTVPLMLNVKQGSCEYQFQSHWFDPTRNRTPSLPIQKQTLYPLDHLIGEVCNVVLRATSVRAHLCESAA